MKIKILAMDVDGTLTDGTVFVSSTGEFCKGFNVKDGYGIAHILPSVGIVPVIITGRISDIVKKRAEELSVTEIYQGVSDKLTVLEKVAKKYGATLEEVAYIGDDLNDLDCIVRVGRSACPSDAAREVAKEADHLCGLPGGRGAVREFIDLLAKEAAAPDPVR